MSTFSEGRELVSLMPPSVTHGVSQCACALHATDYSFKIALHWYGLHCSELATTLGVEIRTRNHGHFSHSFQPVHMLHGRTLLDSKTWSECRS